MEHNFARDGSLKEKIIADLTAEEKSISGLQKSLETKGVNLHRLVLTGYLRALVDMGILKEKEIKPARIYSLQTQQGKDIYGIVGSVSRNVDEENAGDNALCLLSLLFSRPIFVRELERCNVELPRNYRKVAPLKRQEYIKKREESGIKIPQNNMMMEPIGKESSSLIRNMKDVISTTYDLKRYVLKESDATQSTLD